MDKTKKPPIPERKDAPPIPKRDEPTFVRGTIDPKTKK